MTEAEARFALPGEGWREPVRDVLEIISSSSADGIIRPHDRGIRLTVAVGGHPLPLIVRANGDVEEAGMPGTLLGLFEDIDIFDQVVDLEAGDSLVMLTDGVLEAGRDRSWETETIPRLLADSAGMSPDAIADRITAAVSALDERRTDDVAVLVMRCRD